MKKFFVIFLLLAFISPVLAELNTKKINNTPEGVFRKTRNGEIAQYDKKGKKIGVYKVVNGRYIRVK